MILFVGHGGSLSGMVYLNCNYDSCAGSQGTGLRKGPLKYIGKGNLVDEMSSGADEVL
jgi:hypothetical protein